MGLMMGVLSMLSSVHVVMGIMGVLIRYGTRNVLIPSNDCYIRALSVSWRVASRV